MALAELSPGETPVRRSIAQVRAAGREAALLLAESERLKARAVAQLVEFDAIDAHVAEGFLTPQRHLIHRAGVAESEANRIQRLVRFCADHPSIAEALETGRRPISRPRFRTFCMPPLGSKPREQDGPTTERNLALVCRRHHTMIHQTGWQLCRTSDGRIATTSP